MIHPRSDPTNIDTFRSFSLLLRPLIYILAKEKKEKKTAEELEKTLTY